MILPDIITMAASSSEAELAFLLSGPAAGGLLYALIYRYYRNQDKSHSFETETLISAQPIQGGEQKVDHISKTKRKRVQGDNASSHRERVQRLS